MRPLEFGTEAQFARAACDHEGVSFGSPVQSGRVLAEGGHPAHDWLYRRRPRRISRSGPRRWPSQGSWPDTPAYSTSYATAWASLPSGATKPTSACLTVKRHDTTVGSVLSRMGTTTRSGSRAARRRTASCALAHDRPGPVVPLELEPKPLFGHPGLGHPAMAGCPRFANGGHSSAGGALRAALHFNACLAETGWLSRTPDCHFEARGDQEATGA